MSGVRSGVLKFGSDRREGPVEPRQQFLDIRRLYGRPDPDTQTRRRLSVGVKVEAGAFFLNQGDHLLHKRFLRVGIKFCDPWIGYFEGDARVGARGLVGAEEVDPVGLCDIQRGAGVGAAPAGRVGMVTGYGDSVLRRLAFSDP